MKIHEYQAKQLMAARGIAVPEGVAVTTVAEAVGAARSLIESTGNPVVVVKSQIHAGGRGKGRFKEHPDVAGVNVVLDGIEGGIEAAYRAEIDNAEDPQAKLAEIEARLEQLRSPFRTAETFWIEEMIDPRDTRSLLCEFANLAAPLRTAGSSHFGMRP